MVFKSSYNLFMEAEYFLFQEKISRNFGSPLHAKVNKVLIPNFQLLRSANLAIVRAKFVFSRFLEIKAFRVEKKLYHNSYLLESYW